MLLNCKKLDKERISFRASPETYQGGRAESSGVLAFVIVQHVRHGALEVVGKVHERPLAPHFSETHLHKVLDQCRVCFNCSGRVQVRARWPLDRDFLHTILTQGLKDASCQFISRCVLPTFTAAHQQVKESLASIECVFLSLVVDLHNFLGLGD